jgi:hypothetical protein
MWEYPHEGVDLSRFKSHFNNGIVVNTRLMSKYYQANARLTPN